MEKEPREAEGWLKRMCKYIFKKGGGLVWVVFFLFIEANLVASLEIFSFPKSNFFREYSVFNFCLISSIGIILSVGVILHRLVYTPKREDFNEIYQDFVSLDESLNRYTLHNTNMKEILKPKLDKVQKDIGEFGNKYFSWVDD